MSAPYLDLAFQGRPSRFSVHPLERAQILGSTKRVAVDARGQECEAAWLTHDGRYLLHAGSFADLYVNERGDSVERREIVPADADGRPLESRSSTRGRAQILDAPVSAEELLQHVVTRVYTLDAEMLDAALERALRGGSVFRVAYRPRATTCPAPAFLLANAEGVFLVQAEPSGFAFIELEQPLPADPYEDPDNDAAGWHDPSWWGAPDSQEGGLDDAA